MIDSARIAELRRICSEATPGPWDQFFIGSVAGKSVRIYHEPKDAACIDIAHIPIGWFGDGSNPEFIAAARTALPELLDEIERLRKQTLIDAAKLSPPGTEEPNERTN